MFGLALIWLGLNQFKTHFIPDEHEASPAEAEELLEVVEKVSQIEKVLTAGLGALLFSGLLGFWLMKGIAWRWPDMADGLFAMIRLGVFGIAIVLVVPVYLVVLNRKWVGNLIGVLILVGFLGFAVEGFLEGVVLNEN